MASISGISGSVAILKVSETKNMEPSLISKNVPNVENIQV
jgi:hypothetical protein